MFFPTLVLGTFNSVMSPIVTGTHRILETQTFDMNEYRRQKDKLEFEAMKRNPETAYLVDKESFDNKLDELGALDAIEACGMYVDRAMYNMKKAVQNFFREMLELMFNAAALVIDTLRTFFLIVLSILGPISFAISCWDGFHASLTQWFVRYISIYLWLPVSDLFSSVLARIQVLMLQKDIEQLSDPNFIPDGSNAVYIIFLIIGIIGYFTIPTVANWIIQAGGGMVLPKNTLIMGNGRIQGDRLSIEIASIEHSGTILPVELAAYDTDGLEGIYISGSMEASAMKEVAANLGQNLGTTISITNQSAGNQLLSELGKGAIQGVSQYISKKMREEKVHLKSGYTLMLYQNNSH